uniref:Uncharacterized protein n=1 Tax=Anopheles coluzzii TaxID=1518534 RepID=A0A6E8W243_ANOCL
MVSNITRENVQKTTKYPSLVDLDVVSHPCSTRTSSTAIFYYDGARISSEHNYVDKNDRLTLPAPYNPFIGPKTSKGIHHLLCRLELAFCWSWRDGLNIEYLFAR